MIFKARVELTIESDHLDSTFSIRLIASFKYISAPPVVWTMATYKPSFVAKCHHDTYASISEANHELSCEGKMVFITGGGRGIGRAIAKSFAIAKAEGIFLIGRNKYDLQTTAKEILTTNAVSAGSTKVLYFVADITDAQAVSSAIQQAIDSLGRIDVLVQNAGYLDAHRSVIDSDLDDFWRTFEVNVKGGLTVIQEFLKVAPVLGATLINIGSGAGHIPYIPGYAAYSASKLSLAKIVEYVHHENPHLRVFNINPGAIATEMQAKAGDIAARDNIGMFYLSWLRFYGQLLLSHGSDKFPFRFAGITLCLARHVRERKCVQRQIYLVKLGCRRIATARGGSTGQESSGSWAQWAVRDQSQLSEILLFPREAILSESKKANCAFSSFLAEIAQTSIVPVWGHV